VHRHPGIEPGSAFFSPLFPQHFGTVRTRHIADIPLLRHLRPDRLEHDVKLPIRNYTSAPLTLFVEPYCDQYEIPPQGEAIVMLDDGEAHSLDFHPENWVSLWDEGENCATVEIVSKEQNTVVDALDFARGWLNQYGSEGKKAAAGLNAGIHLEEKTLGYLRARFAGYQAFREGFRTKALEAEPESAALPKWNGKDTLADAYRAGGVAAYFNYRTRLEPGLVELGQAPFDTDTARRKFDDADAMIG
jgi:hypothetical protein